MRLINGIGNKSRDPIETARALSLKANFHQSCGINTTFGAVIFFGRDYEEELKEPPFRAKKDVNIAKVRLVFFWGVGGGQDYAIL